MHDFLTTFANLANDSKVESGIDYSIDIVVNEPLSVFGFTLPFQKPYYSCTVSLQHLKSKRTYIKEFIVQKEFIDTSPRSSAYELILRTRTEFYELMGMV